MSSTLKSLRALADPTRLRIMALLEKEELSVNELQEIMRMGQSRISTHLGLLQEAGLLQSRREGKRTFYRPDQDADSAAGEFIQLAVRGAKETHEHAADQLNLKRILARRSEQAHVAGVWPSVAADPAAARGGRPRLRRGSVERTAGATL